MICASPARIVVWQLTRKSIHSYLKTPNVFPTKFPKPDRTHPSSATHPPRATFPKAPTLINPSATGRNSPAATQRLTGRDRNASATRMRTSRAIFAQCDASRRRCQTSPRSSSAILRVSEGLKGPEGSRRASTVGAVRCHRA